MVSKAIKWQGKGEDTGRVIVSMRGIMCEETSGEQGGKHNHLLHCSAASSKISKLGDGLRLADRDVAFGFLRSRKAARLLVRRRNTRIKA